MIGIDVSHYQGQIDWNLVRKNNIQFAITKATEGSAMVDPLFNHNIGEMQQHGFVCGIYHFFRPKEDAYLQARFFLNTIAKVAKCFIAIDAEVADNMPRVLITKRLTVFLEEIKRQRQSMPFIYTNHFWWDRHVTEDFSAYPLWIADYTNHGNRT